MSFEKAKRAAVEELDAYKAEAARACARDGGPAFPYDMSGYGGMSLRDWFAGQALAGWVETTVTAKPEALNEAGAKEGYSGSIDGYIAFRAYLTADAMLAAREVRS